MNWTEDIWNCNKLYPQLTSPFCREVSGTSNNQEYILLYMWFEEIVAQGINFHIVDQAYIDILNRDMVLCEFYSWARSPQ
jgi:hypothetical protein